MIFLVPRSGIPREEGRMEGRQEEKLSFVRSLLENTDFGDEKIATLGAVDVHFVNRHRQALMSI